MPKQSRDQLDDLLHFLDDSPTSWHAVDNVKARLLSAGYAELQENETWKLSKGSSYFVIRQGSLCAFSVPKEKPIQFKVLASHTDSPGLKLKPNAEYSKENMLFLGLEIYGSPLLSSWLNRDLGIAGRILFLNSKGKIEERLVKIEDQPVVIPQLAIHLDREVNTKGLLLDKQTHIAALASVTSHISPDKYLENLLKKSFSFDKLLAHDLFLFPLEKAAYVGSENSMIASYRIDSLISIHAIVEAFYHSKKFQKSVIPVMMLSDNEEIGSETAQGAGSSFFANILERIILALELSKEEFFKINSNSLCLSVDLAHAFLPNYAEKYEPQHQVLMEKGIAIKFSAQQRYASEATGAATIVNLCLNNKIPYQQFVTRSDIPCGSTIGPIHARNLGMSTVDIGCPQLSMHSCRELTSAKDYLYMNALLKAFLAG